MYHFILSDKRIDVKGRLAEKARKMGLFDGLEATEGAALHTL